MTPRTRSSRNNSLHRPARDWASLARLAARSALALALVAVALSLGPTFPAEARSKARAFAATLTPADRQAFEAYYAALKFHEAAVDAYWARVARIKKVRRARLRKRQLVTEQHYVTDKPPKYSGPPISKALSRAWRRFRNSDPARPSRPRPSLPNLADYLAYAKTHYNFAPERIPEAEFKRRYAKEALRLGLTKEQVVRVYALETGGLGTADMVAGIHPIRRTGRPISSAMGYAQLLAANTLLVLQKHGASFEKRLIGLRDTAVEPQRRAILVDKIRKLRAMRAYVNRIPRKWRVLQRKSRTGPGRGVHAINIDGDIGPWVQVIKLRDVKRFAERKGRSTLSSEQLELMNLAGPGTGIEMMSSIGSRMPTSNFFSRRGYYRNSIVRGRVASELLQALGDRMNANERNSGAREFAAIFDRLLQRRQARREARSELRLESIR
ncbi:MAG: hypothetical protein AAFY53_05810 [Pseudomonadota bacterium]